jgi:hypothetical protein
VRRGPSLALVKQGKGRVPTICFVTGSSELRGKEPATSPKFRFSCNEADRGGPISEVAECNSAPFDMGG